MPLSTSAISSPAFTLRTFPVSLFPILPFLSQTDRDGISVLLFLFAISMLLLRFTFIGRTGTTIRNDYAEFWLASSQHTWRNRRPGHIQHFRIELSFGRHCARCSDLIYVQFNTWGDRMDELGHTWSFRLDRHEPMWFEDGELFDSIFRFINPVVISLVEGAFLVYHDHEKVAWLQ